MSLDVNLMAPKIGSVFEWNITHNLTKMAKAAELYIPLWRPEEANYSHARDLITVLEAGLNRLKASPDEYKKYNPANGWGNYEGLCEFVSKYLAACKENPDAEVDVWR